MAGINVTIGADTTELEKGVKKAKQQVAELGKELRDGVSEMAKWGAAATAAGVAATAYLVKSSIDASRELERMRQLANASNAEFQKGAFAARSVGIETDKYADILKDVNDKLGDFVVTGQGPMVDFFEQVAPKVGVTAEQFRKLSGPQALQLYVDSLEKANLSQQEMTFFMEAIASDSTALLPLLRDGGKAMQEQADQAERLGLVLSDIDLAVMREAEASFSKASKVMSGFVDQLAADLSPVLTAISNQFLDAAADAGGVGTASSKAFEFIVNSAAFVISAVDGIKRVFTITADLIVAQVGAMLAFVARKVQSVLEMIDHIPGVDMSAPLASVRGFASNAESVVSFAMDNIEETLNRPLAGDNFKAFVADAVTASEEAARQAVDMAGLRGGAGGQFERVDPKAKEAEEKKRLELERQLQAIRDANATELELLQAKFDAESEILNQALESKMITQEEWFQLEQQQKQRHEEALTDIEKKAEDARLKLAEQQAQRRREVEDMMWSSLTSLMSSNSRKLFEIGKASAIAESIMNTYKGATKALELGWPLGPIAAASIVTAGLSNVARIKAQSFGSNSTGGGAAAPVTGAAGQIGQSPVQNTFSVDLKGFTQDQNFSGNQIGGLIGLINEEIRAGGRLESIST